MSRCLIITRGLGKSALHQETQIKTALKFLLIPVTVAAIKKRNQRSWRGRSTKGTLHTILVGCKLVQTPWKSVLTNHKNRCSRALQTTVGWRAGRTDSGPKDSYDFQRARVEKEERKEDCPPKNKTNNKQNSWARAAAERR